MCFCKNAKNPTFLKEKTIFFNLFWQINVVNQELIDT